MARTTVFSWKVTDNRYGYLWTDETQGQCITNRITDSSRLEQIVGEVSSWDESTYASNFSTLSNLIHDNFGSYIQGDYSIYYNGNNGGKSFIMLTGKDGSNSNGQGGSEINSAVLEKLKTYISNQVTLAKEDVKSEFNEFKASTNQRIDVLNTNVDAKIDTAINEIEASTNSVIDGRMSEIAVSVKDNVLSSLEQDVPVSSLQELVNGTRMHELEAFVNERTASNTNTIENVQRDVASQNERISGINTTLQEEIRNANERIDNISDEVNVINNKVDRVAASSSVISEMEQSTQQEQNLSKGIIDDDFYALETETIDNEDGTFDIISRIGSETYNIKILAFGNKLKVGDKTKGLVLASNGIKYMDKSGSSISIINGNIKLTNEDGSGKLEIKKDGLYINGIKQ